MCKIVNFDELRGRLIQIEVAKFEAKCVENPVCLMLLDGTVFVHD